MGGFFSPPPVAPVPAPAVTPLPRVQSAPAPRPKPAAPKPAVAKPAVAKPVEPTRKERGAVGPSSGDEGAGAMQAKRRFIAGFMNNIRGGALGGAGLGSAETKKAKLGQ